MSAEPLVGTSIPRFTYDTPTIPGADFYTLCASEQPLVMIFLPGFDHPVSREYITRYHDAFGTCTHCRSDCHLYGTAVSHLAFNLTCDSRSHDFGVELRTLYFVDINLYVFVGDFLELFFELLHFLAALADDEAGT